jgi:hypothetical protein
MFAMAMLTVLIIWFYWMVNRKYSRQPEALAQFGFVLEEVNKSDDEWSERIYVSERSLEEVTDAFIRQMARLGYESEARTFRNGYKTVEFSRAGWFRAGLVPNRTDPGEAVFYCYETDSFWQRAMVVLNIER